LVDDQQSNLLALEAILQNPGYSLIRATSGEQALRRVLEEDFAVILLDIQMDGLDGFETARLMRSRERSAHTPIIFLTAYESPAFTPAQAYTLGAVDYLVKPIVGQILRAKVGVFVELYRRAERIRLLERHQAESRAAEQTRQQLSERAEAERARLEAVLQQMPAGVVLAEAPTGRVTLANRRVSQILRRPAPDDSDLASYAEWNGVHADGQPYRADDYPLARAVRNGETVTGEEIEYLRGDGTRGVIRVNAGPVCDGDGRVVAGIAAFYDATEQRRAADSLRFLADASAALGSSLDQRATLAQLVGLAVPRLGDWCAIDLTDENGDLARLAVAHVDSDKVALANELHRLYPPSADDAGGAMAVFRSGRPQIAAEITDDMFVGAARDARHLDMMRRLGIKSYVCVPLLAGDRTLGVLTLAAAESGRRYGTPDLALAEDLAARATAALENGRLYRELQTAAQRKDEFLAMLSHELRSPLAPLLTSLEVVRHAAATPVARDEALDRVERQVKLLGRLVDDLVDATRLVRGAVTLRPERLDLARLARTVAGDRRAALEQAGLALAVQVPETPLWINGDAARLTQVLDALLDNAARFSKAGSQVTVAVHLDASKDSVILSVRDEGVGIEPRLLPRVFEPFAQASQGLDRSQGGLGLGLTLVKGLVELHGGTVRAASEGPGRGAEFIVCLPGEAEPPALVPAMPEARSDGVRPARVVVVEDQADAAESLRALLEIRGHEVRVARSGPEGIDAARTFSPDVVVSDIGLPGFDGLELARRVRRLPGLESVLLVALSGYAGGDDRRRGEEAGFDCYLRKPADPAQILQLIESRCA
jgi:signal transduction histidine kinase/DNA-binding response OmpR family regulator